MKYSFLYSLLFFTLIAIVECKTARRRSSLDAAITSGIKEIEEHFLSFKNAVFEKVTNMKDEIYNVLSGNVDDEPKCTESNIPRTTPDIVKAESYPVETHTTTTEDGYVLTMHRIPHSKQLRTSEANKTVLLFHGLLGSSADWVLSGRGKGLAFDLSDAGYDVWMTNARGNRYSRKHTTIKEDSPEYWNFSWQEMADKDLPATIDYIISLKDNAGLIDYIGYSSGNTIMFALLSTKTEYNKKLRSGIALAPVVYLSQVKSPYTVYAKDMKKFSKLMGSSQFPPKKWLASGQTCEPNKYEQLMFETFIFGMSGYDELQFNRTLLPTLMTHLPAGTSIKAMEHYIQEYISNGNFQHYDFGSDKNSKIYGSEIPPVYNLRNITLPIAVLSAKNDWLSYSKDVGRLYNELQNKIEHYTIPSETFNHMDFLWAMNAPLLVNKKVLELLVKKIDVID